MNHDFALITGCKGYVSKTDPTNTDEMFLINGSQNVVINDQDKIETRLGYSLFGASSAVANPIVSARGWRTSTGTEIHLRFVNDILQFYSSTTSAWENLLTGLDSDYPLRWDTAWNSTELIDILLFVNHSSILYEWSGGMGTLVNDAAVTATTIDINETIASQRFLTSGTRSIMIKDTGGTWRSTVYTAQSGSQFTVSTDLSAFTFDANAPVVQVVRTNANTPASGFTNDVIATLENQIHVGSHTSRRLYISKSTSYTDFTFSTPRVPTEGALLTMDDTTTGLIVGVGAEGKEQMIVFSGRDRVYRIELILLQGDTTDREAVRIKPIPIAPGQGARSQELIGKTKNSIIYLSADSELVELGALENVSPLQYTPISDPVRPDFLDVSFTNGHIFFWRSSIYISAPVDSKTFVYDAVKKFWQPPQILPGRIFSEVAGDLYMHSNAVTETYLLFDGTNDNTNPISFKAHFAYRNSGKRDRLKNFDHYFSELYISSNAEVTHKLIFEYLGAKSTQQDVYMGTDTDFLFSPSDDASLGVNSLGTNPLGATLDAPEELVKYRRIKPFTPTDHFEFQCRYEMDIIDARFQILSHGPNVDLSKNSPTKITQ